MVRGLRELLICQEWLLNFPPVKPHFQTSFPEGKESSVCFFPLSFSPFLIIAERYV